MEITAAVDYLITEVELHMEAHKEDYAKARVVWYEELGLAAGKMARLAKKEEDLPAELVKEVQRLLKEVPQDKEGEYRKVLQKLRAHTGKEIALQDHEVDQLVSDDWSWAQQARFSNSAYSGKFGGPR